MTSAHDDTGIEDHEIVLRRVAVEEVVFDENAGRLRPAGYAFLQGGRDGLVSVYLASEASPETVWAGGPEEYLASITVGMIRQIGLGIVRDSDSGGSGHCVVTGRKTRGRLNQIVRNTAWVDGYAPSQPA